MAIVSMKKLTLVGYGKDKNKILRGLEKTGCVEIQRSAAIDKTYTKEDIETRDGVRDSLLRIQFVFDFLKSEDNNAKIIVKAENKNEKKAKKGKADAIPDEDKLKYSKSKKKLFNPTPRFDFEEFYEIVDRRDEIFDKIAELEKISGHYSDIKAEITKLQSNMANLAVFRPIAVRLSAFADTKNTSVMLGTVNQKGAEIIEKIKADFPEMYAETVKGDKLKPAVVICLKRDTDAILERLNEAEFVRTTYNFDMTADEKLKEMSARVRELRREKQSLLEQSLSFNEYLGDFKQLYDYYTIEDARLQASDGFAQTRSSFILEGWYPVDSEERVLSAVNAVTDAVVIETREPVSGDSVPTLTRNNKVAAPYECITNMYSPPNYHDIDPNPFVAFFYFLMFGMMMGDAVYGLILMLLGFAAYYFMKPTPGKGKLVLVIAMGGISTIFWGIMFGGWLSFDGVPAVMFKPIDANNPNNAIYMLLLSLGMGVVQINFGMGIHAYDLIRRKKDYLGALYDVFSWYFVLLGIIFLALSMLLKLGEGLKIAGIVFCCLGVAIILLLGGRGKKGIKRITGGFGGLYGGVNFLSDILSYSRLFGLGLATTVIGMVVNEICKVIIDICAFPGGVVVGVIIAAPIFVIGHVFNIGINTLGTYIHNSRLQFIEFFSRFYEGGGHMFKPLGSNTKYTYIKK